MQADTLAAVALLVKTARWYESRSWHPAHVFYRRALALRAAAMTLLRGVRGYTLQTVQMRLPL